MYISIIYSCYSAFCNDALIESTAIWHIYVCMCVLGLTQEGKLKKKANYTFIYAHNAIYQNVPEFVIGMIRTIFLLLCTKLIAPIKRNNQFDKLFETSESRLWTVFGPTSDMRKTQHFFTAAGERKIFFSVIVSSIS